MPGLYFCCCWSSRRRHTSWPRDWSSDVCSSDLNGLDNCYFLAENARFGIDKIVEKFGKPNIVLLDPPRSGAGGKVMRRIGRTKAERVVYVSCNPASFAVDIKELEAFGYQLEAIQPVDLFPQTVHVELVALMSKVDE